MVFLSGGYKVKIYDNKPGQASGAITEIRSVENRKETLTIDPSVKMTY